MEESRRVVERRQEELQHALRIAAHDQHRQHVLEHQDEHRDEDEEHSDRLKARAPRQHGDHDRREGEDQSQHQPRRDEELDRIFEVEAEPIVPAAALGHQAERQPHQRAERRLDGAHVDRTDGQQQEEKAGRTSIRPRSFDQPGGEPAPPPEPCFDPGHPAVVVRRVMIVAEQVKQAVQGEDLELGRVRVAEPRAA